MQKKLPLILVLVAIVIAGGAYFFFKKNNQKMPANQEQKAQVQEMLANCKYDKDFCAYMAAQAKAMQSGVIITTTSQVNNFGLSTNEMKIDGANNMEINTYKDGKIQSSMIVFEKVTYFKNPDGSWYAMNSQEEEAPSSSDETISEIKNTYNEQNADMKINKVGTEACGDLTCDKYEIINVTGEQSSTMYAWVDTKEHLARKMEFSFEGGLSTMEYKYEPVKISKPSPIKEMPVVGATNNAPGNVPESAANAKMPTQEEIDQMMKDYSLDGR